MLMDVQPQAWNVMMILAVVNLVFGFLSVIGVSSLELMAPILVVSELVFIYCMLPGTRQAFRDSRVVR